MKAANLLYSAAIASIVSLYYRVKLQKDGSDPTWKVGYVLLWAQIEMFAGVAASSMPTVHKFFSHRNFSLWSWQPSLKASLLRLASRSKGEKLPTDSDRPVGGAIMHSSGNGECFMMKAVKRDGLEREMVGDSQIYLTRDVTVTQEQLSERYN
ncbi:hypothetical protein CJF32_00006214 [Rutstroemia sp. NJR-2017a WRK4]|nr:hypothetical protein CJF32_00006214 [Rutstroemia sp. NJR-2017a WRK4]